VEPPEETEAAMFEETRRRLHAAGYRAYEISNFSLPGREARHNLNYWRAGEYLGLGAGAHSYRRLDDGGHRWSNEKDPARYMAAALAAGRATCDEETLDRRRSAGEFAFLNLRLADGFTEDAFRERFGEPLDDAFPELDAFVGRGLLERRGGRLALTDDGILVSDSIFATFV
jgi:oxygen-independent coproporphyrinogen III oxidase